MKLNDCHNFHDFRKLAKRRLPSPIFNYIDGAAEDETTYARNTASFEQCDLVPNVLRGTEKIDQSVEVMGQKLEMPIYCSPTALQRVFHHEGENAVAAAASKYGTLFGVSSLGTASLSDIRKQYHGPQCFQFYFHKDRGLNQSMLESAKNADVDVLMLTVDTITGGKRERDLRTGFSIPFKLTLSGLVQFIIKPNWGLNYITHPKFGFPQLDQFVDMSSGSVSVGKYFTDMLDPTMTWNDVEKIVQFWNGQFCLKGIMSVSDAKRAVDIGCTGIVVSNHGGRQLDGSRSPFDQVKAISDAVGDKLEIVLDGGVRRGTHVLKAIAAGAKACSFGKIFLFSLAAGGQQGVEKLLKNMHDEINRNMVLMGCKNLKELNNSKLIYRK